MLLLFIVLMPCLIMDCYNQYKKYAEEKSESKEDESHKNTISGPLSHSSLYVQNELSNLSRNSTMIGPKL